MKLSNDLKSSEFFFDELEVFEFEFSGFVVHDDFETGVPYKILRVAEVVH